MDRLDLAFVSVCCLVLLACMLYLADKARTGCEPITITISQRAS